MLIINVMPRVTTYRENLKVLGGFSMGQETVDVILREGDVRLDTIMFIFFVYM